MNSGPPPADILDDTATSFGGEDDSPLPASESATRVSDFSVPSFLLSSCTVKIGIVLICQCLNIIIDIFTVSCLKELTNVTLSCTPLIRQFTFHGTKVPFLVIVITHIIGLGY